MKINEKNSQSSPAIYTCNDYREEMVLLALRQKLAGHDLLEDEKRKLKKEIAELEKKIGF